jgi:hypothetical protein
MQQQQNTYWIRKSIKHPMFKSATKDMVREGVKANTPEEAIKKEFGDTVIESGVHNRMIVTSSSNDNGYRYWTVQ